MITYRPDIDGLRALAVLPVILFHFGTPGFSGGFIGVDVFFVISGYLITSIILKDLTAGTFSFAEFYERRARRILPAFFLVTFATLIIGAAFLLPGDFKALSASAASSVLYLSNFYFWWQTGYFQTDAQLQPLLHTWSLAIEEQFYILFPLFLFLLYRFWGRRASFFFYAMCALGSLALAEYFVRKDAALAFYMLPTRAWELGLGGILAYHACPPMKNQKTAAAAGSLGLILIAAPAIFYAEDMVFPGLAALIPCLGACLMIYAGTTPNIISRIFAQKPLTAIGKISYSLYLWHWPLIAFANYRFDGDVPAFLKVGLFVVTFALAYVTWRYVENPWRDRTFLNQTAIAKWAVASSACLVLIAACVYWQSGFPSRFSRIALEYESAIRDINPLRDLCNDSPLLRHTDKIARCEIGDKSQPQIKAVMWGDSVADSWTPGVSAWLQENNLKGIQLTRNSCAPLPGAISSRVSAENAQECTQHNEAVLKYILSHRDILYVFLAGSWYDVARHIQYGEEATHESAFMAAHSDLIESLIAAGKKPIIFSAIPHFEYVPGKCLALQNVYNDPKHFSCEPIAIETFETDNQISLQTHRALDAGFSALHVIFPHEEMCKNGVCSSIVKETVAYYDQGHLTSQGAILIMGLETAGKNRPF